MLAGEPAVRFIPLPLPFARLDYNVQAAADNSNENIATDILVQPLELLPLTIFYLKRRHALLIVFVAVPVASPASRSNWWQSIFLG